jgi:hypothetical protein
MAGWRWQVVASVGLLCASSAASSTTLRVPTEYRTINQALNASVSGDTVLVAWGVYTDYETHMGPYGLESSCAFLKGGVVLCSESGPEATVIDMVEGIGFVDVVQGYQLEEEVVVSGFTITSSLPDVTGVYLWAGSKGKIQNCIFRDIGTGQTTETGVTAESSDVEVIGCTFRDINGASGAGIAQGNGTLFVDDCWFENIQDCAIMAGETGHVEGTSATIRNSTFLNNFTEGGGAAINIFGPDPIVVEGCWFEGNVSAQVGGALSLGQSFTGPGTVEVRHCIFVENQAQTGRGGALRIDTGTTVVVDNTFYQCSQGIPFGGSAAAFYGGHTEFLRNVVAGCSGGSAVILRTGTITSDCNVFWENPDGDVEDFSMGPNDRIVDPLFCDPEAHDFTLQAGSPCLPENSGICGQIGALGLGCGATAVGPDGERISWGAVKEQYRVGD